MKIKNEIKGITLIALVITIIVLLILAGVSISMLTGENGVLTKATQSKEETQKKDLEEQIKLAAGSDKIVDYTEGNGNLEEELRKIENATVEKLAEDAYYVERDGKGYTVYEDGTIEEGKTDIWDGTTIEKAEIDENNNWHIYTTAQMKYFAKYCNNELTEEEKAGMPEITDTTTVYLENNLDMGARQKDGELTSGVQWTSIKICNGIFEGNNHSISGIYIKGESQEGLFSSNANKLQNLTIKNSYIESTFQRIGGIAGYNSGEITNCHNINTTVKSSMESSYVGGIVGMEVGGTIKSCTNTGKIVGKKNVGGICGGDGFGYIEITNCNNSGEIIGSALHVGGIAGFLNRNSKIENCQNSGIINGTGERIGGIVGELGTSANIDSCYNTGNVIGKEYNVGGVAGIIFGNVTNSYNTGKVEGKGQLGGIAGQIGTNCEAKISNCYNDGEIVGNDFAIGGIVGWTSVTGSTGTIEKSYNKGKIKGTTQVGGIIGRNADVYTVTNCYNKGTVEGETCIGAVIGQQLNEKYDKVSNLFYLNTLNIKGINGQDHEDRNIKGVAEDIDNYTNFLTWIEEQK